MRPPSPPRVRALSIHAGYRCRHTGACCTSGWAIPVEPETEERLRTALHTGTLRPGDRDCFRRVPGLPHGARVVLRTDEAGRCVLLDPRRARPGLCAVHHELGEEALPSACRHFPRVVTLTPLGVSVTLSHYCPTAAAMLFSPVTPGAPGREPVTPRDSDWTGPEGSAGIADPSSLDPDVLLGMTRDPALRIVENPEAFPPEWPYEGLDARDALPPLLRPGVLMDWPSLERWERFAVSALGNEGRGPEAALDALTAAAEEARRWTPADGAFDAFLKGVLEGAATRGNEGEGTAFQGAGGRRVFEGALRNGFRSARDSAGRESRGVKGSREWPLVADCVPPGAPLPAAPDALAEADARWVAPGWPALGRPIRHWLASKAFGSWIALQGEGLRTTVAFLRLALGVLRAEAARGSAEAARVLDGDLLREGVRRADLLLLHLADPEALARRLSRSEAAEGPDAAW